MHPDALLAFLTALPQIRVEVPKGDPLWATAAVAIVAALLGSIVGGYASFRANYAMELARRRARAQVRRKAKIYTPIRSELLALREACARGVHMDYWLIVRGIPPGVIRKPASLHIWKDLVNDGRAGTAASKRIAALLDHVDACAETLNQQVLSARTLFA
jgi:hypothetical protein